MIFDDQNKIDGFCLVLGEKENHIMTDHNNISNNYNENIFDKEFYNILYNYINYIYKRDNINNLGDILINIIVIY